MAAKRKKLTKKQIAAGFGGKRRKSALRHTKSKVTHHKTKATTKKKTTKKKKAGTSGIIANNALLNDLIVGAGGAALGYTAKTVQDNFGASGIAAIIKGGVSAMKNAISWLQGTLDPQQAQTSTPITTQVSAPTDSIAVGSAATAPYAQASGNAPNIVDISAILGGVVSPVNRPANAELNPITGLYTWPGITIAEQQAEYNAKYG
jgi:hypothetical protein